MLAQANRNGFFYVLDRTNGKLLAANPYVKVNWADRIDLATGRPVEPRRPRRCAPARRSWSIPSVLGGKNWTPMSWNPATGLAYANTLNMSWPYKIAKPGLQEGRVVPRHRPYAACTMPKDEPHGYLKAIDPMTGKSQVADAVATIPSMAGTLSTAGGLVFTGAATGEFMAVDANTGKKLWQFQTGSGIDGLPVTWEQDGVQYVAVTGGYGGVCSSSSGDERLAACRPAARSGSSP